MRKKTHTIILISFCAALASLLLLSACMAGEEVEGEVVDEDHEGVVGERPPESESDSKEGGLFSVPAEEPAGEPAAGAPEVAGASEGMADSGVEAPRAMEKGESTESAGSPGTGSADTASGFRRPPAASGLTAGFADDNKQFSYFLSFLERYGHVNHYPLDIRERIILQVSDSDGKSLPNAEIEISAGGRKVTTGRTFADGSYPFFPSRFGGQHSRYTAEVTFGRQSQEVLIDRQGARKIELALEQKRPAYENVELDLLFVLDTTGSMGEEIERLKTTIDIINLNLVSLSTAPRVRFGMVLYKDRGDEEYRTRIVHLTDRLPGFQRDLEKVTASGGGDTPEDLEAALELAVKRIRWNRDGIRLAFIITDAPPQLYESAFRYVDSAEEAKRRAIKIFSVGTGGLDLMGEYVLRQIAQYTSAKYIFLTYGETGESEGGIPGSVSHHTGANYQTDKLESIIIRIAKEELSHLTDQPLEEGEEYFEAVKVEAEEKEETLGMLFDQSLAQLIDYATFRLPEDSPTAALPILATDSGLELNAEYFTDQLIQAVSRNSTFKAVERQNMQDILEELELQLSDLTEPESAPKVGQFLGAGMLIAGKLYKKESFYELFLRLLRVETAEILAVTKARIDTKLGL
jgi:Mg-chelatase subunit ChlD